MLQNKAFQEAIDALSHGQKNRARDLLTRLLKRDSSNPEYWLWMSAVVDSTAEQVYCLQNVLQLDPNNRAAKRGLALMGAQPPDTALPLAPVVKRKWATALPTAETTHRNLKQIVSKRSLRIMGILAALIILIGLLYFGITAPSEKHTPTATFIIVAITPQPTKTPLPSATLGNTSTPVFSAATPLKAYLEATYTPIPAYVNTPHPILEAYSIALRSYERGDYARMISYLEQALREEPTSPDITYLLGEGYRKTGDLKRALDLFENSMSLNAYFAPPYLGRALIYSETEPTRDISTDLERAIELDPYFVEAYLALAEFHLEENELAEADRTLAQLMNFLPYEDARYYWLKARILLAQNDFEKALEAAQTANTLDQTMLPVYLTLAQAYLSNNMIDSAINQVKICLRYEPENPTAWFILAQAQYLNGENEAETLNSLAKAIELNPNTPEVYWYRGSILLNTGDYQTAINDLLKAVHLDGSSFTYNLDLGRALYGSERFNDAIRQLNVAARLASDDKEKAALYYWRARTLEANKNLIQAREEWKRLLALPASAMPLEWRQYAQEHLLVLETPTPTITLTPTTIVNIKQTPTKTTIP
jgi:tetratricopeptide (TPR) repeat protein